MVSSLLWVALLFSDAFCRPGLVNFLYTIKVTNVFLVLSGHDDNVFVYSMWTYQWHFPWKSGLLLTATDRVLVIVVLLSLTMVWRVCARTHAQERFLVFPCVGLPMHARACGDLGSMWGGFFDCSLLYIRRQGSHWHWDFTNLTSSRVRWVLGPELGSSGLRSRLSFYPSTHLSFFIFLFLKCCLSFSCPHFSFCFSFLFPFRERSELYNPRYLSPPNFFYGCFKTSVSALPLCSHLLCFTDLLCHLWPPFLGVPFAAVGCAHTVRRREGKICFSVFSPCVEINTWKCVLPPCLNNNIINQYGRYNYKVTLELWRHSPFLLSVWYAGVKFNAV